MHCYGIAIKYAQSPLIIKGCFIQVPDESLPKIISIYSFNDGLAATELEGSALGRPDLRGGSYAALCSSLATHATSARALARLAVVPHRCMDAAGFPPRARTPCAAAQAVATPPVCRCYPWQPWQW